MSLCREMALRAFPRLGSFTRGLVTSTRSWNSHLIRNTFLKSAKGSSFSLANAIKERANVQWTRSFAFTHSLSATVSPNLSSDAALKGLAQTNASSASAATQPLPTLAPKSVGIWLMVTSTLVFAVVVIGGVTRLTESGLSITEWRPITGVVPPLSEEEWEREFDKYKATPEFKVLNSKATLSDFKFIYSMEWSHRLLGRLIGLAFVLPIPYFFMKKRLSRPMALRLVGLSVLLGMQGVLGWYMVQSGLDQALIDDTPSGVPRVSQYRLAAHLGAALAFYLGVFGTGMAVLKDWRFARGEKWSGVKEVGKDTVQNMLRNPVLRNFKRQVWGLTGLVFLTAVSGAFVAGLDAGLQYNEFPLMGGHLAPPSDELMDVRYARQTDKSDLWWRNIFENPTTVQFDHRVLAITTYFATAALFLRSRSLMSKLPAVVPPAAARAMAFAFGMANIQVLLGITTLLYLVPVPLAAAHQAGSVLLLSAMTHVLITLRRPSRAARAWRKAWTKANTSTKSTKPVINRATLTSSTSTSS